MNIKSITNKVTNNLLNDDFRQPFLVAILSFLLTVICTISAIPHYIKDPSPKIMAIILTVILVISTAIFFLTIFAKKYQSIWRHVFMVLLIGLFGYCCWDGGPQGFIHLWVLLIPAFSFITFGIYEGFITAIPTMIIMLLFFWIPPIHEHMKYTDLSTDFRLRMTLVYFVSMLLGFIAELLRRVAAKRLKEFTDHFEYISMHDSLTNLANQNLLAKYLEDIYNNKERYNNLGCLFVDVDAFKNVNDSYGHLFGNVVLIKIADILSEERNAFVCRWGGDEYVVCFSNIEEARLMRIGEKYRATISATTFEDHPDFHITVSVGAVVLPVDEQFNFNHVLDLADKANRTAKDKGKDNVSLAEIK